MSSRSLFVFLVLISSLDMDANAWLPKLEAKQIYVGKYVKNEKSQNKSCSVTIQSVKKTDNGLHCFEVTVQSDFSKQAALLATPRLAVRTTADNVVTWTCARSASKKVDGFSEEDHADLYVLTARGLLKKARLHLDFSQNGEPESFYFAALTGIFSRDVHQCDQLQLKF